MQEARERQHATMATITFSMAQRRLRRMATTPTLASLWPSRISPKARTGSAHLSLKRACQAFVLGRRRTSSAFAPAIHLRLFSQIAVSLWRIFSARKGKALLAALLFSMADAFPLPPLD